MVSRKTALARVLTLLIVVGGCAHDSTTISTAATPKSAMYRGNAARTGAQPGPGPAAQPEELWHVELDEPVLSSAVVAGGVVYVKAWDNKLHALNAETGDELWSFETGGLDTAPAVVDGVVYAGGADRDETSGTLYAIDAATGHEIWHHDTVYALSDSSPVVVDGIVYVGGGNGEETSGAVYAIDAAGNEVWSFEAGMPIWSAPAVAKGVVYVGGGGLDWDHGAVFALDAKSGAAIWTFDTNDGPVLASPAVSGGLVYATSGSLSAINAKTGKQSWTFAKKNETFDTAPAVVNHVIYVGGTKLMALDAKSGATIWSFTGTNAYVASPVVADRIVYAGTYDAQLLAIHAERGDAVWRFKIEVQGDAGDRQIESSPAVIDGVIYFASFDAGGRGGAIHAIATTS
jgi:outer membrane protein assembly factor BamB